MHLVRLVLKRLQEYKEMITVQSIIAIKIQQETKEYIISIT